MTAPMDPNDTAPLGNSEYGWGEGLFPPGIAANEGQSKHKDDFTENLRPRPNFKGSKEDNWARMVADKRTDPTDSESGRDFEVFGNPDRYGPNDKLVKAEPEPDKKTPRKFVWPSLVRRKSNYGPE